MKQRSRQKADDGFTLIELMVVLLILAILLAIVIPTELGARNTANARSPQAYVRNALTAESDSWSSDQTFANQLSADEPSLSWRVSGLDATAKGRPVVETAVYTESIGTGGVLTTVPPVTGSADGVEIVAYGRDGNCYALYQSHYPDLDFTAYEQYPAAPASPYCDLPTPPAGAPVSGAASSHPGTGSPSDWYSAF